MQISGWASKRNLSSVVPDRGLPMIKNIGFDDISAVFNYLKIN
jgi:hypothetical protein